MELGGGIFYGYVVVDVPLLVSNLTGCERNEWTLQEFDDARRLLDLLIHATAQVTPGAKLGATAPYARAECVILEVGDKQPRSLANAFLQPINSHQNRLHPMGLSIKAMAQYMSALDEMCGDGGESASFLLHRFTAGRGKVRLSFLCRQRSIKVAAIFGDGS